MKLSSLLLSLLVSATLLSSCARHRSAIPYSGIHPNDVRLANSINEDNCKFIKQQTCSSKRKNGVARCEKWHKQRAAKSGANFVVLISSSSDKRPFISGGQLYTSSSASSTADYYSCVSADSKK